jgi:CHAT domain-containing protein
VEKTLEGVKTVYYSPSGLLHKINFNAIPVKGDSLLIDAYNLNLVSSTREIVHQKNKISDKPSSAVIYGGLLYGPDEGKAKLAVHEAQNQNQRILSQALPRDIRGSNFGTLRNSFYEGDAIELEFIMNNIPVTFYSSYKGNEESFKNLDGKKVNLIHLATHGFFMDDIERNYEEIEQLAQIVGGKKVFENPLMRSGLALAGANNALEGKIAEGVEDGILFADDITNLNLVGADLVVLSTCDTALGVVNNSEGVFGLQRAFKLAGAETIVMSLWKVDDKATADLMARFYENWLSGGMGKQEAFKKAQGWLREKYSSPYFWAAFVMMD